MGLLAVARLGDLATWQDDVRSRKGGHAVCHTLRRVWHADAHALIALQVGLAAMNIRGAVKNNADTHTE